MQDQFNRDRVVALDRLRAELEAQHAQDLLRLKVCVALSSVALCWHCLVEGALAI
jgi:hypothetical protein